MKKGLILVVALMLCVMMVVACAAPAATTEPSKEASAEATQEASADGGEASAPAPKADGERIKIGVTEVSQSTEPAKMSRIRVYKTVAEVLGVDLVFYDAFDYTADGLVNGVETLISQGCDGILFYNVADTVTPTIQKMCDEAGVAYISNAPIGDDLMKQLSSDKLFLGNAYEENFDSSYEMVNMLNDLGAKNIIILSVAVGNPYAAEREVGVQKAVAENNMTILKTYNDIVTGDDVTKAVESAVVAYPELDGIFIEASTNQDIVPSTMKVLENYGLKGKVKVGGYDHGNARDYIGNGLDFIDAGMQFPKPAMGIAMLVNFLEGDFEMDGPVSLRAPGIIFTTPEEMEVYSKYCENPEVDVFPKAVLEKDLIDANPEQLQAFSDQFSIAWLEEIHS